MQNIKFITLTISKCPAQWHEVNSYWATIATLNPQTSFLLAKLKLSLLITNPRLWPSPFCVYELACSKDLI